MRFGRVAILGVAALTACAQPPLGPLVQVVPGRGKSVEQFQGDALSCRRFADMQTEGQAEAVNDRAVGGAFLSTALGAGLGAIVGGGRGAAFGAVTGAGIGTSLNAASSASAQGGIQLQYDSAYAQCMFARGNDVPGYLPLTPVVAYQTPVPAPAQSELVRQIQFELNRVGVAAITPDGVAGPRTISAIQLFQNAHRLPPDGIPSSYLLAELRETPPGY